ncbi:alginate lyase family protein [Dinghuibacter silviterrae]|uniref:Alginate lyase n=1 Tax=Dinghuibacter silviterrae TaxID=1539049 RepID=A0A4R8DG49_9BACT|nr:alginate lyase family protein [Dinghuibacter silviterrae]TDW96593.1 alginate lyase [Dinghuibacter silviterrae]
MTRIPFILFFVALAAGTRAQFVSLNKTELSTLRHLIDTSDAYKTVFAPLKTAADEALGQTPNPIEKIRSEGLLQGNPLKTASLKAVEDGQKVYSLALVYRLDRQRRYLDKARDYLLAWARTNKATGDPIDETKLEDMITGYDLVRGEFSTADRSPVDAWLDSVAAAEAFSKYARPGKTTSFNNWNSHRLKIVTLIAYTIHTTVYDTICRQGLEAQLAVNLNADGTTWDLLERDAFHYHLYDLEPLLRTCMVLQRATGKDYFTWQTPKGASIKHCVDYLLPYMTGEKTHGEFVNSKVAFDQQRGKNHEKGYESGTLFDPKNGLYALSLAAYFDRSYLPVIQQAGGGGFFSWTLAMSLLQARQP